MEEENSEKELNEEQKEPDTSKSWLYSLIGFGAMIVIVALIILYIKITAPPTYDDMVAEIIQKGSTEYGYMYNGFVFIQQQGLWHTKFQRGDELLNLHFHNSPAHVDQVPVEGALDKELDMTRAYLTFDPSEENLSIISLALNNLNLNLVKGMGVRTTPSCTKNETTGCANRPIITCNNTEDAVIYVKTAETTKIILDNNCATLQGKGQELMRSVDRFLFDLYGVTKFER